MMRVGAIVAAAGLSSRMREFKPMLRLGSSTMIRTTVDALKAAGVSTVAVVVGHKGSQLAKHLSPQEVLIVENPGYQEGDMFDSVKLGLAALTEDHDALLVLPADLPLFEPQTVRLLLETMERSPCPFMSPVFHGKKGHPLMLQAAVARALCADGGEGGLKGAIARLGGEHRLLEVDDPGILMDADCPQEYQRLRAYASELVCRESVSFELSVSLMRGAPFWNGLLSRILEAVDAAGSLNKGCELAGISYSKGWRMIQEAQHHLGIPLLDNSVGGVNGGGSAVTPEARLVMAGYDTFCRRLNEQAQTLFDECLGGLFEKNVPYSSSAQK